MLRKSLKKKTIRYILLGGITAAFNLAVMFILIELLNLNTPLLHNIANISAIEISLIFSFFVYRLGVWRQASWEPRQVLLRQFPLYQLSTASILALRSFIIFPILNWIGINYLVNTLIGIILGSTLSYFFNDRLIFSK